jgi:hypothetical protein
MIDEVMNTKAGKVIIEMTPPDLEELIKKTAHIVASEVLGGKNEELITRQDAMELLGVKTVLTMIRWERKGYLNPRRIGGRVLYKRGEVLKSAEEFERQ